MTKNNQLTLSELIAKIRNTRDIENLNARLGKELGSLLYLLIAEAEKADKELDIVHRGITKLYNIDGNVDTIQSMLKELDNYEFTE